MKFMYVLALFWVSMLWDIADACDHQMYRRSCNDLHSNAPSGVYKILLRGVYSPIEVYCERAHGIIGGKGQRAYTFLPRSFTRRSDARYIINALFKDKKNVLLKLQKKADRSEAYTLIQPHPRFAKTNFAVLINRYYGYTQPRNHFMKDQIFLGILRKRTAKKRTIMQGFRSNGHVVQFRNCDANPNSYFAFFPNHNQQTPSNYHGRNLVYERRGVAVDWRSKAKPITNPDRMMPNEFFFFTELHFGGCGTYTSSDRWNKFGYHATAIGIR